MKESEPFSSSSSAEEAFYIAFQSADIHKMMDVWAQDQEIFCIHPGGPRLDTRERIRKSWLQIFEHETGIQFEIKQIKIMEAGDFAIHHVIEAISINGELQSEIIATNVYANTNQGWRMILHHASPELHTGIEQTKDTEQSAQQTIH